MDPRPTEDIDWDLPETRSKCLDRGENALSLRSLRRRGMLWFSARPSESSGIPMLSLSPVLPLLSPLSSSSWSSLFQGTAPALEVIARRYRVRAVDDCSVPLPGLECPFCNAIELYCTPVIAMRIRYCVCMLCAHQGGGRVASEHSRRGC